MSTRRCQLFHYIRGSLGLTSIVFVNIEIRLFIYSFKDDISNLYFNFNICYNSSTKIILAFCLASFNSYLTRNINSFI